MWKTWKFYTWSILYLSCSITLYHMVNGYFWWKHTFRLSLSEVITLSIPQGKLPHQSVWRIDSIWIASVTDDFENQWYSVLYDAEKRLVKLLFKELENVIAKVQNEIELIILDSETTYELTLEHLEQKMRSLSKTWRNDEIRNGKSFSKTL